MSQKVHIKTLLRSEDAFLSTSEKIYGYFLEHTRQILIILAVVAVLVVGVFIFFNHRANLLTQAAVAYELAMNSEDTTQVAIKLEKVRIDFPGTAVERQAAFSLVDLYAQDNKIAEATALMESLAATLTPAEESLKPLVFGNLAAFYEEGQELEKALKNYQLSLALADQLAVQLTEDTPFQAELLNSVGRVAEALGENDVAEKAYQDILTRFPDTYRAYGARLHLARLKRPANDKVADSSSGGTDSDGSASAGEQ